MKRTKRFYRVVPAALIPTALLLAAAAAEGGQVVADNTLGHGGALSGPHFGIPASIGKQVGQNLFESFRTFTLSKGDIATFTGPNSVHNVLARVTGGTPSVIDGTISCSIPNADFYLINPSGVVFKPDAKLDVKGSFAVSTADELQFKDGQIFSASNPASPMLTSASPSAFGFLSAQPAAVAVQGTAQQQLSLAASTGKGISIVGGSITIGQANLSAPAGSISIVAAAAGNVPLSSGVAQLPDSSAGRGTISASNSTIDASLPAAATATGGQIVIAGSNVSLDTTQVLARNASDSAGLGITFDAIGTLTLSNGTVDTSSNSYGASGNISVSTSHLVMQNESMVSPSTEQTDGLADLTVTLNIQFPTDSDLSAQVTAPGSGPSTYLFEEYDTQGANFTNTTFDQNAGNYISGEDFYGPYGNQSYKPASETSGLGVFGGASAPGPWTLTILNAGTNTGTLDSWMLKVNGQSFSSMDTPMPIGSMATINSVVTVPATIKTVTGEPEPHAGNITLNTPAFDGFGTVFISAAASVTNNFGSITPNPAVVATLDNRPANFSVDEDAYGLLIDQDPIAADTTSSIGQQTMVTNDGNGNYTIAGGVQHGGDLFFSLDHFDLASDQTATFDGSPSTQYVLARVTGNTPSNIEGIIGVNVPGARLYLINPAGIVFGTDGTLAAGSTNGGSIGNAADGDFSFVGTTANYVGLGASARFYAVPSPTYDASLTSDAPGSFGFTSPQPAPISILGGPNTGTADLGDSVEANYGQNVSLVAGDIRTTGEFEDGYDAAVFGLRVNVVSVGTPSAAGGVVTLGPDFSDAAPAASGFKSLGTVTVLDGSDVVADGDGVTYTNATLDVLAQKVQVLSGAQLLGGDANNAVSGTININANDVYSNAEGSALSTGVAAYANLTTSQVSQINIHTATMELVEGGAIIARSYGDATAGNVTVDASGRVLIDGGNTTDFFTGITVEGSEAVEGGSGAGQATIDADSLLLENGGQIRAVSNNATATGSISVTTRKNLKIDGASINTNAPKASGGDISLRSLHGNIRINNDAVTNNGPETAIDAEAGSSARVSLSAPGTIIVKRATIDARANLGNGGEIVFNGYPKKGVPGPSGGVILQHSTIVGLAHGRDVRVRVNGSGFVESTNTRIETDRFSTEVESDLAASLIYSPVAFDLPGAHLQQSCPEILAGNNVSTFTVGGRGNEPVDLGTYVPDLNLSPAATQPGH